MPVNSNTLIHFTSSLDILKVILEGDFYPRLCLEKYDYLVDPSLKLKYALPMVCFCDIPLHLVMTHMEEYGSYGIGLRKEWGIERGLNPIQYIQQDSYLQKTIAEIYKRVLDSHATSPNLDLVRALWNLLAYTKPYSGLSHKNNQEKAFYDEREWRYFPNIFQQPGDNKIPVLEEAEYKNELIRENTHQILKGYALRYAPSDIKYIIVKDESEILEISQYISRIKGDRYTANDLEILKTKIISAEYMSEDF